jgi:hypothetical protein
MAVMSPESSYIKSYRKIYPLIYGIINKRIYDEVMNMTNSAERRQATRFRGALPIEWKTGAGITRDFSASGIFFETDQSFSSGESVEFALKLEHFDPGHSVHVRCRGEVVRVERGREKLGVAMVISSYWFERPGEFGEA